KTFDNERLTTTPTDGDPNLDRLGVAIAVWSGLGLSLLNGINGWFRIYRDESRTAGLWHLLGPVYLVLLVAFLSWILLRPLPRNLRGNTHPRAYAVVWFVLIVQNAIAQLVTGPHSQWNEMAFSIYYLLLFTISGVIVYHARCTKAA